VCVSHFVQFSVFLAIFHVIPCEFLIFYVFQFSRPIIPGPTVDLSHFSHFPVFLDVFQVLPCEFLIFLFGQFSCHIPGPTVCISHFSRFSMFLFYISCSKVCV